jgi:hypothetical protein
MGTNARAARMAWVLFSSACALAACNVFTGIGNFAVGDVSSPGSVSGPDASDEAQSFTDGEVEVDGSNVVEPPPCDPTTDPACMPLPEGWTLAVMIPPDAGAPPTGFSAPSVVRENPAADPGACSCASCTVKTQGTCSGNIKAKYSSGSGCGSSDPDLGNKNPGQCEKDIYDGNRGGEHNRFDAPSPQGGSCETNSTLVATKLKSAAVDIATGAERCDGGVCDARVPAPFRTCLIADSDKACPAGFAEKHVVGDAVTATCGACPACTVSTTCGGTLSIFSDSNCTSGKKTFTFGVCDDPGLSGSYNSYKYEAAITTNCTAPGGTRDATGVALSHVRALCCR